MDPHSVTTGSKSLKKGRSNKIPRGTSFLSEIRNMISVKPLTSFDVMDFHSNTTSTSNSELNSELNLNFDYCSGKKVPLNSLINAMFRPQLKKLNRDVRLNNLKLNNKRIENIKNDNFYLYGNANNDIDDDNRGTGGGESHQHLPLLPLCRLQILNLSYLLCFSSSIAGEDRNSMSDCEDNGEMGEFWDNDNDSDNDVDNNNECNNDNLENRMPNIPDNNVLSGELGSAFGGQNMSPGVCSGTETYNPFEVRYRCAM